MATGGISSQKTPRWTNEIPSATLVFRDFGGMNVSSPRQSIGENQFSWLENFVPIAPGTLRTAPSAQYTGILYPLSVVFEVTANVNGIDYIFTFLSDGSAQFMPLPIYGIPDQFAAPGTFTTPYAVPYTSTLGISGLLIVDPITGYADFAITASTPVAPATTAPVSLTLTFITTAIVGRSIAVYAGRVWISGGKSISFTDVDSYNSFSGAGGGLTINDSYLHRGINSLYSSSGYLYIFGDTSIDVLSNVQVTNGVTSFSRTNITTSIGTSYQQSVMSYYRSIMFVNNYGVYALSGATPQKISDDIDKIFDPTVFIGPAIGGQITLFGELCACWMFKINDIFTKLYPSAPNGQRVIFLIFLKGKWFIYYPGVDMVQMVSVPVAQSAGGAQTIFALTQGATSELYQLAVPTAQGGLCLAQTKLWDAGQPILDKEVLRAGLGVNFASSSSDVVNVTTDNEYGSSPVPSISNALETVVGWVNNSGGQVQWQNNSGGDVYFVQSTKAYALGIGASTTCGGKYFGMSVTTNQTNVTVSLMALEYRATRPW